MADLWKGHTHKMTNAYMSKGITPNDRLHTVRATGAIRAFRGLVFDKVEDGVLYVKEYDGDTTNTTRVCLGFAYTAAADGDEFTLIALGPIVKGVVATGATATAGGDAGIAAEDGGTVADVTLASDGATWQAYVGTFLQSGDPGDVVQIMLTGIGRAAV